MMSALAAVALIDMSSREACDVREKSQTFPEENESSSVPHFTDEDTEQNIESSTKRMRRKSPTSESHESDKVTLSGPLIRTQKHGEQSKPLPSSLSGVQIQMTREEVILVGSKIGRPADPRMNNATVLKLRFPDKDNFDILTEAGFRYPSPTNQLKQQKETFDEEGVSLRQRKNQLNRRFRKLKPKYEGIVAAKLPEKRQQLEENLRLSVMPGKRKAPSATERADSQGNARGVAGENSHYRQMVAEALQAYQRSRDEEKKGFYN